MMTKKTLYVDMDNVLVDFPSAFARLPENTVKAHQDDPDEIPGIFSLMDPVTGAVEAHALLSEMFDTYILSTAPWRNPSAWADKLLWVQKHLGDLAHKRLILSHHKNLNRGHFLVDDRTKNGVDRFEGEHIHFGSKRFPGWPAVIAYLRDNA